MRLLRCFVISLNFSLRKVSFIQFLWYFFRKFGTEVEQHRVLPLLKFTCWWMDWFLYDNGLRHEIVKS